jgi:hypothetical protein
MKELRKYRRRFMMKKYMEQERNSYFNFKKWKSTMSFG